MSDILTPNFGESVTSATVAAWHKNVGDPVAKGDTLVTLETDKVSTDLEADESGVLEILVPEGRAPVGPVWAISPPDGLQTAEKEEAPAPPEPQKTVAPETREEPLHGRRQD
ncbi:MAG: lipoyl domain-containing protein [Akkermansia sp.]